MTEGRIENLIRDMDLVIEGSYKSSDLASQVRIVAQAVADILHDAKKVAAGKPSPDSSYTPRKMARHQ